MFSFLFSSRLGTILSNNHTATFYEAQKQGKQLHFEPHYSRNVCLFCGEETRREVIRGGGIRWRTSFPFLPQTNEG